MSSYLVFELRDADGTVIYVGSAVDLADAFGTLAQDPWFSEVDPGRTTATPFADAMEAELAARALRTRLQPRHNFEPQGSATPVAGERAARDALAAFAEEQRTAHGRRLALVDAARDAGLTWREIAAALEMSEEGLRKAVRRRDA